MSKHNGLQLLLKWIAFRCKFLLAVTGGSILFVILSLLSHVDARPSVYGAGLCLFVTLIWSIYDFIKFTHKSSQLARMLHYSQTALEPLPDPFDFIEEQYQQLIMELYHDLTAKISEEEKIKSDREDYYILWVHQIKTPISALRLLLHSDDLQKNAFAMEQELFKIEQYAEMVLQYLRLESLSCDLLLQEYSLYTLVKQAVKKYAGAFISRGLSLDLAEFGFFVITDEKWLCFVLEQLLSNSVKYTFKGGVNICMDPESDRTLLITDTGIGIREEDLPRVFDRGFTGYNGRMDRVSTGIGLYLCKRVTDRLGITLHISSKCNKGTQYRIYFPPTPDALQK
ncbi:MAG: HAMP domain-containing histidine kinase [Ruminococcaceae bacterium]|nr:HAMP domain-containing histidine kinase [Oscillospiraceae bacterium]